MFIQAELSVSSRSFRDRVYLTWLALVVYALSAFIIHSLVWLRTMPKPCRLAKSRDNEHTLSRTF